MHSPTIQKVPEQVDQAVLEGAQQMAEATGTLSSKKNYTWLEIKKISRVAKPRNRYPERYWRYSHGQGHKQQHLIQKLTYFELEWDSKTQEITLSFSSYHSLFMKSYSAVNVHEVHLGD